MAASSTYFTVGATLTSGPLSTVYFSCSEQHRRSDHGVLRCVLRSEAPVVELSVLCVPVFELHTEGESLSAEVIALPTVTEGREPGLASMGTIWTWRRWTSSLPTLLPSLRGWMVDAQQYHVPRGVCKKSIIPAAHRVHSDQSLS